MTSLNDYNNYLPASVSNLKNPQTDIPRIAKDKKRLAEIISVIPQIPTKHSLFQVDSLSPSFIPDKSVHLVVTSPPYWMLKKYVDDAYLANDITDYDRFLKTLHAVWKNCYRVLVPGGRLVCVVSDLWRSRRENKGRHTVVPLHAAIQESCRKIGFDSLAPIIWYKLSNSVLQELGKSRWFLGKPYEPNAVIKNDIDFILMERKPGGYRKTSVATRVLSIISDSNHKKWFQSVWLGIKGGSAQNHRALYPQEIAERLIRMCSFVGDTVLDPFMGTGTTTVAAATWGRNSIGVELDSDNFEQAEKRINYATSTLFSHAEITSNSVRGALVRREKLWRGSYPKAHVSKIFT